MHMQYVSYLSKHGQTLVEKKMAKKVTRQSLRKALKTGNTKGGRLLMTKAQ